MQELTPLIYTPTVGEACQRWSELYTQPEGESIIALGVLVKVEDVAEHPQKLP